MSKILHLLLFILLSQSLLTAQKDSMPSPKEVRINNDCSMDFDMIDEFSGKRKRGLKARWFFSFTPESYQKFFPEDDYLRCEGYLVEREGELSLHLRIIIQDKTAKKTFGALEPQSKIFLYPMRGNPIALSTFQGAKVLEEPHQTIYECSYPIKKSRLKELKKIEIDRIRINWSKGFQTYEVYYLDFLLDQFACLTTEN
jgi:hypothetical protein